MTWPDESTELVRVRIGLVEGPTVPATPPEAADSGSPATGDAGSPTNAANGNDAQSFLVVEISIARDPASDVSPSATAPAATDWAALRLTITPPDPGQAGGWMLNLAPAPGAGDATDAGSATTIPPLDFVLQADPAAVDAGESAAAPSSALAARDSVGPATMMSRRRSQHSIPLFRAAAPPYLPRPATGRPRASGADPRRP